MIDQQSYSKREVAEIQLVRAAHLIDEDPVSALTLAGAAEEILGTMARLEGHTAAVDGLVASIMPELHSRGLTAITPRALKDFLNSARNQLKHHSGRSDVVADFRRFALSMILRAAANYRLLYRDLPTDPRLRKVLVAGIKELDSAQKAHERKAPSRPK